jgi:hypothetical protein
MGNFEKGLEQLTAARQRRELNRAGGLERALSIERLADAELLPGDQVVDRVTGKGGHVAAVGFARDVRQAT